MFSALTQSNEWIHLLHLSDSQIALLPSRIYTCPDCGQELYLKRGPIKAPHFAHVTTCPASSESPAESAVHFDGKLLLYQLALSEGMSVQMEHSFKTTHQRADLYLPMHQLVLEYQCSSTSHSNIALRQSHYLSQNNECLWILHLVHMPIRTPGFHFIKLSQFIQSCIRYHPNGMRSLLFWDAAQNASYFLIIYESFAHEEFLVELLPVNEMRTWMWFVSPKASCVQESIKETLLYKHQVKHIQHLFHYLNKETYVYHRLARKWKVQENTFPLYIGMAVISPHTLGREVKWQFKVVNFIKSQSNCSDHSVEDLTDAFLYSLPTDRFDTVDNRNVIQQYIHFLRAHSLPQNCLKRTGKDRSYISAWQRFQTLAKPSKD